MRHFKQKVLTVFIFLFGLPVFASSLQYAVIIDAGSSGSRAHVFQYAKALPMIPVPVIADLFNKSTRPGLSSYANDPSAAGSSLKPILDASSDYLQAKGVNLAQVPVSVLATAGMRLLPADEQVAIYANVRSYIRANYAFSLSDQNVRTITGEQEGLFGWLDVNYLQKNFLHPPKTIGSIDMGGSSTQIAFATSDTSQPEKEIVLTINHTVYRVFSQSFLGLGQDQARKTMTNGSNPQDCYPAGYPSSTPVFTGDFHLNGCTSNYNTMITDQNVAGRIIPTTNQLFIAYAGIYFNYSFFGILQTPTQEALLNQINTICMQSWSPLQLLYPNDPFLSNHCANGTYFNDLLYNTYGLQGSQLTVTDTINGTGIDWTLGALLYNLVQS
jgi:apyrase